MKKALFILFTICLILACSKKSDPTPANTTTNTTTTTTPPPQLTFTDGMVRKCLQAGYPSASSDTIDVKQFIKNLGTATVTIASVSGYKSSNITVSSNGTILTVKPVGVYAGVDTLTVVIDYTGGARMTSSSSGTLTAKIIVKVGQDATINTYNIVGKYMGVASIAGGVGQYKMNQDGTITTNSGNTTFYGDGSVNGTYTIAGNSLYLTSQGGTQTAYNITVGNGFTGFTLTSQYNTFNIGYSF